MVGVRRARRMVARAAVAISLVAVVLSAGGGARGVGTMHPPADDVGQLTRLQPSGFQRDLLNRGLDAAAMQRAATGYVQCLERLGVEAHYQYDARDFSLAYVVTDPTGNVGQFMESDAARGCHTTYLDVIEYIWADLTAPDPGKRKHFYDAVAECLRANGTDVANSQPTTLAMAEARDPLLYDDCFERVRRVP